MIRRPICLAAAVLGLVAGPAAAAEPVSLRDGVLRYVLGGAERSSAQISFSDGQYFVTDAGLARPGEGCSDVAGTVQCPHPAGDARVEVTGGDLADFWLLTGLTPATTTLLRAGGGGDQLRLGPGADQADGGSGDDRIDGGAGRDVLDGGTGDDRLTGGAGRDVLGGGTGDDRLELDQAGGDVARCGAGRDVVLGGSSSARGVAEDCERVCPGGAEACALVARFPRGTRSLNAFAGTVRVRLACPDAPIASCGGSLRITRRGTLLARAGYAILRGRQFVVVAKLTAAGARASSGTVARLEVRGERGARIRYDVRLR